MSLYCHGVTQTHRKSRQGIRIFVAGLLEGVDSSFWMVPLDM